MASLEARVADISRLLKSKSDYCENELKALQELVLDVNWRLLSPDVKRDLAFTLSGCRPSYHLSVAQKLIVEPWNQPDVLAAMKSNEGDEHFLSEPPGVTRRRLEILRISNLWDAAMRLSRAALNTHPRDDSVLTECVLIATAVKRIDDAYRAAKLIASPSVAFQKLSDLERLGARGAADTRSLLVTVQLQLIFEGRKKTESEKIFSIITPYIVADKELFNHAVRLLNERCKVAAVYLEFASACWCFKDDIVHVNFNSILPLLLRGIAIDLAALEPAKSEAERRGRIEKRLAQSYDFMARLFLNESKPLYRECLLTAFSLEPRPALFERVKECAAELMLDGPIEAPKDDEKTLSRFSAENLNEEHFERVCDDFEQSLKKIKSEKKTEKRRYFPGALLSIDGRIETIRTDYDPFQRPLDSFRCSTLSDDTLADVLTVINAGRWAVLSWALDWPDLEDHCRRLMQNPTLRLPPEELRNLEIDYTQFDEWSSDEDQETGIEKGYENWVGELSSDEEKNNTKSETKEIQKDTTEEQVKTETKESEKKASDDTTEDADKSRKEKDNVKDVETMKKDEETVAKDHASGKSDEKVPDEKMEIS